MYQPASSLEEMLERMHQILEQLSARRVADLRAPDQVAITLPRPRRDRR